MLPLISVQFLVENHRVSNIWKHNFSSLPLEENSEIKYSTRLMLKSSSKKAQGKRELAWFDIKL